MFEGVSWNDYAGMPSDPNLGSPEYLSALHKALQAGAAIGAPGTATAGDGFALRTESLENSLKVVTYKTTEAQMWRAISKVPAYNTQEEFNQLVSYGSGVGGFIGEMELPDTDDSTYRRAYVQIKFMGTTRGVSHVMQLIRPAHGNVVAQEVVNGTAYLIRLLEHKLHTGDSRMIPMEFDGVARLIEAGAPNPALNVIDMRGLPLSEEMLNDGMLVIKGEPNYGQGTDLYMPDGAYGDLAKAIYPAARVNLQPGGQGWTDGMIGLQIRGFQSQFGPLIFHPNTFMQFGPTAPTTAAGKSGKRPDTPVLSVALAAGAVGAGETSKFEATDAGDYVYTVTVAAGQKVTFSAGDGSIAGTCFDVYRSDKDGTVTRRAYSVVRSGAVTVITDLNDDLPGTCKCELIQQNLEFFSFKQLAPMVKVDLAVVTTAKQWMQLIYGAPALYAPGRGVVYKNVGRAPGSAGRDNATLYG